MVTGLFMYTLCQVMLHVPQVWADLWWTWLLAERVEAGEVERPARVSALTTCNWASTHEIYWSWALGLTPRDDTLLGSGRALSRPAPILRLLFLASVIFHSWFTPYDSICLCSWAHECKPTKPDWPLLLPTHLSPCCPGILKG